MSIKIGISGHIYLEDPLSVRAEIALKIKELLKEGGHTRFDAFTSLAPGADSIFGDEVLKLGGRLNVILPFPKEFYLMDFEKQEDKSEFDRLFRQASAKIVVRESGSHGTERSVQYLKAGKEVVDKSDVLIVVWDEQPSAGTGGTGDIVAYAKSRSKRIIHIKAEKSNPAYETPYLNERFSTLEVEAEKVRLIYDRSWQWALFFSYMAAVFFITSTLLGLEKNPKLVFSLFELLFVSITFCIIAYIKNNKIKERRIQLRREAEIMRTLTVFTANGIPVETILTDHSNVSGRMIEAEQLMSRREPLGSEPEQTKAALQQLARDQITYHKGKTRLAYFDKRIHIIHKYVLLIKWIFFTGVLLHVAAAFVKAQEIRIGYWESVLEYSGKIIMYFAPPTYALLEGIKYFKEWDRLSEVSHELILFFTLKLDELEKDHSREELNEIAAEMRREMDRENRVWGVHIETKELSSVI